MKRGLFRLLGLLCIPLVRLWLFTLRVRIVVAPELVLAQEESRAWVLCFFHGMQFGLLRWPRRRTTGVLVSHSQDGALQARFLRALGFHIVRGSSSHGGTAGLRSLVRFARSNGDLAFAVDGPRGPYGEVKGGALASARLTGARLVPMGAASSRKLVLGKAWDRFEIPLPFARVCVVVGPCCEGTQAALKAAIELANQSASDALGASSAKQLRGLCFR